MDELTLTSSVALSEASLLLEKLNVLLAVTVAENEAEIDCDKLCDNELVSEEDVVSE